MKRLEGKVTAILPSLNPDEKLLAVVDGLARAGFARILLVDDGSKPENRGFFEEARRRQACVVLRHAKNLGKGRALKTAFNYFLNHQEGEWGVVTVDGDGQHRPEDVAACAQALLEHPDSLILGCRDFSLPGIPARSRRGNQITAACFRMLCGIRVSDTQTGLRGLSADFLRRVLNVAGEGFEYETNVLLESKKAGVPLWEVPIQTVYLEHNASSHFHPLRDSLRIYRQIFKFLWSSLASAVLDFLLFLLLESLLRFFPLHWKLLGATLGARLCSSLFNYMVNKKMVFGSAAPVRATLVKYYLLCAVQTAASYGGVYLLVRLLHFPSAACKLAVDTVLFFLSYQIQREWIFRE